MKTKESIKEKSPRRILIVDDHAVVREGLKWVIEREADLAVVGEVGSAEEALSVLKTHAVDLALVDIALPGTSGLELTKQMRTDDPNLRILILSMYKESLYAERALRAGANGYIMKKDGSQNLVSAIRRVLGGQIYVSPEASEILLGRLSTAGSPVAYSMDRLTNRELDVLRLIGEGLGSKEIAAQLTISIKTVEAHREHIRAKLNMHTNSELVQHAIHWVRVENSPG